MGCCITYRLLHWINGRVGEARWGCGVCATGLVGGPVVAAIRDHSKGSAMINGLFLLMMVVFSTLLSLIDVAIQTAP